MNKKALITQILDQLSEELGALKKAAEAAHQAATHEESKAEDQHDTRGLEASYLAGAQAQRATEIENAMSNLRMLELREFGESDAAAVSAYVILDNGKLKSHYFLSPSAGGVVVPFESKRVFVITPQSPLGSEIMGRKTGDQFEIESQGQTREYEISGIL